MSVVKLGSNIASLSAQRRLSDTTHELSRAYERLASGLRINRASDDAAGLSLSQSLRADAKIFTQGLRNLNDGISLFNIAESAIEQLSNITVRLKELAEQAANGSYSSTQRKALDSEAQALSKEYFRISKITQFNGRDLFGGSLGQVNLQAGFGDNAVLSTGVGGAIGMGSFGATVSYAMESASSNALSLGDLNGDGILDLVTAGSGGRSTIRLGTGDGSFGVAVSYAMESSVSSALSLGDLNGDGILDLVTAGTGGSNGRATVRLGTGNGSFGAAVSYTMEIEDSRALTLGDLNGDGILDLVTAGYRGPYGTATIRLGTGDGSFGAAVSYRTEGISSEALTLGDLNGDGILDLVTAGYRAPDGTATIRFGTGDGSFGAAVSYATESSSSQALALGDLNGDGILDLVTTGVGSGGRATVRLNLATSGVAPLLPFSLKSLADARQALPIFKKKLDQLAAQHGTIGAFQSRVTSAINTLTSARENYLAAESRITDADMAEETSALLRIQILQKAASAVLAQANQQPQIAIRLLES